MDPTALPQRSRRSGFTLIELLVVVAIIALLIAILLPSLGRAKRYSLRVTCGTHLRGVVQNMHLYASENSNLMLLGFTGFTQDGVGIWAKQANCFIRRDNVTIMYGFDTAVVNAVGASAPANNRTALRIYYCPAQTDSVYQFDTPNANPLYQADGSLSNTIRAGYGTRPCLNPEKNDPDKGNWTWRGTTAAGTRFPNPGMDANYPQYIHIITLPKTDAVVTKAVMTDLTAMPRHLATSHVDGVNVASGDSSVVWIPLTRYRDTLMQIPDGNMDAVNDPLIDKLWTQFDRSR